MKKISLLILIVTLLNSCTEDTVELPNDCTACQEAIDQMAEDLSNCDPNYSVEEWDQMKVDCGVIADTYVGFMAETCNLGEPVTPECDRYTSLSIKNVPITYYSSTGLPEQVDVTVQYTQDYKFIEEDEEDNIYRGGSDNFVYYDTDHNINIGPYSIPRKYPHRLMEGAVITVTLYKIGTNDELASAEITFNFKRDQFLWHYPRQILINNLYGDDLGYTIEFAGWTNAWTD